LRSFFHLLHNWKESRQAPHELGRMQQEEAGILALDDGNLVNRAKVATEVGDLEAATRFWEAALTRYPAFAKTHEAALSILISLKRFDEAEALMLENMQREPRNISYAEGHAKVAQDRGDTAEATRRWAEVRKKFPHSSQAYIQGVNCLIQTGHLDAADGLAKQSSRRFPEVPSSWMQCARVAELRKDWPEALRRWEIADAKFTHTFVDIGIARALTEMGHLEEADARLLQSQRHDPLWPPTAAERARLARLMGNETEEVLRWADARKRFPLLPFGYQEGARRLLEMSRLAEAEEVLVAAIGRFPTEPWPAEDYAEIATRQQNWEAAEARWASVRAKWPDREKAYRLGAQALTALGRTGEAEQLKAAR
jgi:predicted Zn-dependent protease